VYDLVARPESLQCVELALHTLAGLELGQEVMICKDVYGGAAMPRKRYRTRVAAIDREAERVTLDPAVPVGWFSNDLGLFVLALDPAQTVHAWRHLATRRTAGGAIVEMKAELDGLDVVLALHCRDDATALDWHASLQAERDTRLFNLTLQLGSAVPVTEIFHKNRKLQVVEQSAPGHVWLWKEGCRFGEGRRQWLTCHNSGVASLELLGFPAAAVERSRVPVSLIDSSPFRTPEHGVLAAFGEGKYASSVMSKVDTMHWFVVRLERPQLVRGLVIEWYSDEIYASWLEVKVRAESDWVTIVDDQNVRPSDRISEFRFGARIVHELRVTARKCAGKRGIAIRNIWFKTLAPTLLVNLEHYDAQKFRQVVETQKDGFTVFHERSAPVYTAGATALYGFRIHCGAELPPVPRVMLAPSGYEAVHVWTEHADRAHLRTHRAVYLGDEAIDTVARATGGFVAHRHVVTKSVFFSNPMQYKNPASEAGFGAEFGETVSLTRDPEFAALLDELHALGSEICLHTCAPLATNRAAEAAALAEMTRRYGSRTWIDHDMQQVRTCVSSSGLVQGTEHYMADVWRAHGIRYFWHWASEDFALKNKRNLNLLHRGAGDRTPTPLYWRHPTVMAEFVTWASCEGLLEYFTRDAIDRLVHDWGVSIVHHYPPFICTEGRSYLFYRRTIDGRLIATEQFNEVLAYMSSLRDDMKLLITTIETLLDYWLATELVEIELPDHSTVRFTNPGNRIVGFSFVIRVADVTGVDVDIESRALASGDTLVWFDFPERSTVTFQVRQRRPAVSAADDKVSGPALSKRAGGDPAVRADVDWLLNTDKGFALWFRPRCGSTTATRWFFENLGVQFGGFSIAQFRNSWIAERFAELSAHLEEYYDDLHKFVIVRDPYDRAVSGYLHAVNNPEDYQWDLIKRRVAPGIGKHDLTFRQFVEFLATDDLDNTSLIWRRQSQLSCWRRGVNDVVLLAELNDYLTSMNVRYGLSAKPGFNSVTVFQEEKEHVAGHCYCDVPFRRLLELKDRGRFRNFPGYEWFYDEHTKRMVSDLYREDIRIYADAWAKRDCSVV
jgi:hypothetical protein